MKLLHSLALALAAYAGAAFAQVPAGYPADYAKVVEAARKEGRVFVYNKKLVAESEMPRDRAALAKLLTDRADKYAGKVAMFDIARSGVGYLFAAQDDAQCNHLAALLQALGRAGVHEAGGTGEMLA